MDDRLIDALTSRAAVERVLVVAEIDGTLADYADDPAHVAPSTACVDALERLAVLPGTSVALVSGRSLTTVRALCHLTTPCHLVGSHGLEIDEETVGLTPSARRARNQLVATAIELATTVGGLRIEPKPYGVALHERDDDGSRPSAAAASRTLTAVMPGLHLRLGHRVVDVSILPLDVRFALDVLRHAEAAEAIVYFGDLVASADVLAALGPCDLGIGVAAPALDIEAVATRPIEHWVRGTVGVADALVTLADARRRAVTPRVS